jgi:hypothetical protein
MMNQPPKPDRPKRKPFFTWTEDEWKHPEEVPLAIRNHARVLWLAGAKVEAIAECFNIPVEWAEIFCTDEVRAATRH